MSPSDKKDSMQSDIEPIENLAKRWIDLDEDPETRNEIQSLLDAGDETELERRLRKRITFGTAGLRASMKAGFAYMNGVTVLQASQGLAHYIKEYHRTLEPCRSVDRYSIIALTVVIGYDARHNSVKFAKLAASTFCANGFRVLLFNMVVHTPMVPFAVRYYGAAAGVMITASHNPKDDNGYKVYWSNGSQIIPPHDAGIAETIELMQSPLCWDTTQLSLDDNLEYIYDEVVEAYFLSIQKLVGDDPWVNIDLSFVYTPLHGVGYPFLVPSVDFLHPGDSPMLVPPEQQMADPDFPTVPFPNPEEKGALDIACKMAAESRRTLVLANDPDADRFAAVERLENGEFHQFTGNQMGVLLAAFMFATYPGDRSKMVMLASTVSSRMLAAMAKKEGFLFKETLTGFKWLGNVAQDLESQGYNVLFAYEEAIGYMFPTVVWDKDGIAAAVMFLRACQHWKVLSCTPWTILQMLYKTYGYFEDANTYLISPSPDVTNKVFDDIRKLNDGNRPQSIGGKNIDRWRDLTLGYDSANEDGIPDLPVDASAQMITCELQNVVFTARGSGTEPKIKLYIEAKGQSSVEAKTKANGVLQDLLREWFKPEYGLKLAGT